MRNYHKEVRFKTHHGVISCDKGIQHFIRWMNSLEGVQTLYSCQGQKRYYGAIRGSGYPYVRFLCANKKSLEKVWFFLVKLTVDIFNRRTTKHLKDKRFNANFIWIHPVNWYVGKLNGREWGANKHITLSMMIDLSKPIPTETRNNFYFYLTDAFARRTMEKKLKSC